MVPLPVADVISIWFTTALATVLVAGPVARRRCSPQGKAARWSSDMDVPQTAARENEKC